MPLTIRPYASGDEAGIVDVILPIQREEFSIAITADDQPDLADIPGFYGADAGGFWVAELDEQIVGTIALKDLGNRQTALRKMFVAKTARGREIGAGQRLLDTLLAHARTKGMADIFLGTTEQFLAAHRFYEKNGFAAIAPSALPERFPRMGVDTRFYHRALG
ncbi:GNAT family N-acetyltransferase [Xaviernesmea oryzae]|uniref:GNAT family N-acetyltransferase n=1 Tax=Xaviernesmea oryzae TaxID=464029 RepID=A0A1Q9ATK4_9HYPH|nr:GNAT family N-acetyltransferase [Xaviernesmea oryzae]OLP58671.1 GNAT family N-acetyltransferase [Xaviernesmea oryzae]SEK67024.1 Acetyltransferase (GNAT) family protein [Xaviernesmea oryzae]